MNRCKYDLKYLYRNSDEQKEKHIPKNTFCSSVT